MDYCSSILNKLIDMYENRGAFCRDASSLRAIQFDIAKEYSAYKNRYDHDSYREINFAIGSLANNGLVIASPDNSGRYSKVKLNVENIEAAYKILNRTTIPEQCKKVEQVLLKYSKSHSELVNNIVKHFMEIIVEYKELPYDLDFDFQRLDSVLKIIEELLSLDKETYIRNFSTAILKDSKKFQKEYRSVVESILHDYTEAVVEKEKILEYYNLYENPTYVLIKGDADVFYEKTTISLIELKDGIALSNASLESIAKVKVNAESIITVENLTTYHDCDDENAVYIYLGGFHNSTKQKLIEKIYRDNPDCRYFHKGDIDVYGFLILENLKAKTGVPFEALEMDVQTLERYYKCGFFKELTNNDRKMINAKIDGQLSKYKTVLEYMLTYDCKVEQESVKAVELIESERFTSPI